MDYQKLKSGTDIRGVASEGVAGQEINLTNEVIARIARGFLCWCEEKLQKQSSALRIALGHDSRISAGRISSCLKETFTSRGVTVLDCGLASTPSMFMAVIDIPCDCAVQITASHHPFNRNGLKFFIKDGGLDSADITAILQYAEEERAPAAATGGTVTALPFMARYAEILRDIIKKGVNSENYEQPLSGFKIAVDAGNGAGGFYASDVLAPLGADVSGSQFLEPDGMFPNHVPNPENAEAMQSVAQAVINSKSDLGVIFDTDVDRGAAVDARGNEISRNRLVALASVIALEQDPGGTIVTDSITSDGLKEFIEETLGGKHHRFQRGYKNVINEAQRLCALGISCPLAIETSGHAAMRENYFLDDGAYLVTKIIIKMAELRKDGKTIDDLLTPLREAAEEAEIRLPILQQDFRACGTALIDSLQTYAGEQGWQIAPDNHEGIRVSFPQGSGDGWFLLRLSVHDPIMPLNIESNSPGGCKQIATALCNFLQAYEKDVDIRPLQSFLR